MAGANCSQCVISELSNTSVVRISHDGRFHQFSADILLALTYGTISGLAGTLPATVRLQGFVTGRRYNTLGGHGSELVLLILQTQTKRRGR